MGPKRKNMMRSRRSKRHMGDMEPVKNFRQERDKDRDTVERAL